MIRYTWQLGDSTRLDEIVVSRWYWNASKCYYSLVKGLQYNERGTKTIEDHQYVRFYHGSIENRDAESV